jgi:hypothetical protein
MEKEQKKGEGYKKKLRELLTFFRLVRLGIWIFITVVLRSSPRSSERLASRCRWSSDRQ